MDLDHAPYLGTAAPVHATRTAAKLGGFALRHLARLPPRPRALLDVGCGNGFITEHVAGAFDRVVGVDVEPARLAEFRARIAGDAKFEVREVASDALGVPDGAFAMVTAFEVLEHVADVATTVAAMARAVMPGGVVVVSTPQVLFPIETHGIRIGERIVERKVPLLPYLGPLHRRLSLARVFGSRELDRLFAAVGLEHLTTAYAAPQFERAATHRARWERHLGFVRPALDLLEDVPGVRRVIGVSILKAYARPHA